MLENSECLSKSCINSVSSKLAKNYHRSFYRRCKKIHGKDEEVNHGPNTEPLLEGTSLAQSVRGNKAAQNLTDDPNSHNNPVHQDYDATYCRHEAPREGTNFSANTGLFNLYQEQKINKFKDSLTLLIKFIQREWTRSIPFLKQQGQPVSVQVVHEIPSTIIKKTKI